MPSRVHPLLNAFAGWRCWLSVAALAFGLSAAGAQTTIEILQQPKDIATTWYREVTFSIVARAFTNGIVPAPLTYQWIEEGIEIPGATNATWVRPPSPGCTDTYYFCVIRSGETYRFSDVVRLWVFADCSPLKIVSVDGNVANQEVVVTFDEAVDASSATDIFNYLFYEDGKTNELDGIYPDYITMRDPATAVLHFDLAQWLRSETRYVLHPSSEYLHDLWYEPSCGCGQLQYYPFGLPFVTRSDSCAQIIRQPMSAPTSLGCRATFEVQAEWLDNLNHLPFRYQWFRNGYPVYDATQRTYATESIFPPNTNDSYHVEVYGACETLRSQSVSPVLQTNIETLRLHSIRPGQARHSVIVSFAPACDGAIVRLRETSTALTNFQWTGGLITRTAYRDCTGTNIILFTSPPQPGNNYSLTLSNISDEASHPLEHGTATSNLLAPTPPPLPETGNLALTTAGQLLVLEWTGGGTLQTTYKADGPWQDLPLAESPLVLLHWFPTCDGPHPLFGTYYRVRWPAPH